MAFPILPVLGFGGLVALLALGGRKASAAPLSATTPLGSGALDPKVSQVVTGGGLEELVRATIGTGDPVKVWDLAGSLERTNPGNAQMLGVASSLRIQALTMAHVSGKLGELVAHALSRGEGELLARTAEALAKQNPAIAAAMINLAAGLRRAPVSPGVPRPATRPTAPVSRPATIPTRSPGVVPTTVVNTPAKAAATAAAQEVATAIKATEQVIRPTVTPAPVQLVPEVTVKAGDDRTYQAAVIADHLISTARYKEDKTKVKKFQASEGLKTDGLYGPKTALAVGNLGYVMPPPYYWTKATSAKDKASYKTAVDLLSKKFPELDWTFAIKGDAKHPGVDKS